jgi:DNA recombination protein RmuC
VMTDQLTRVSDLVVDLERDRERKFGELTNQLEATARVTATLGETAAGLREALASPKARGAWGERMAEDVLRLAGFVEGVNYTKQRSLEGGGRPDFTFPLPKGHVVHMDAKFPAAGYLRFLEAGTDAEREAHRAQFLRDVRLRVKELAGRDYVDGGATVDYVLCFIPNESIYGFMHESDAGLLDDAIRQKVVFCSPLSLFAVLAVIRQAFDNFVLEQTSNEILGLLGAFAGQYQKFCGQLDKLGRGITTVERAYEDLAGTRRRALERPLEKLEQLRQERGIDVAGGLEIGDCDEGAVARLPQQRAG